MQCPLRNRCKEKCSEAIFKIIGKYNNHIECNKFKSKYNDKKV